MGKQKQLFFETWLSMCSIYSQLIPEFQIYRKILGSQMFSLKDCASFFVLL